jgi:hypothetical protein
MVSVTRAVADSILTLGINMSLRLYIEDPEHHFISCVSHHPTSLGIYSPRDVTAQLK